jgi:hypothetical protein
MSAAVQDANDATELPSAVPDYALVTGAGSSGGMDYAAPSAPAYRDTVIPLKNISAGLPSKNASFRVPKNRTFLRRVMSDIKRQGRLSHEGVMGAGLARDTDNAVKSVCRAAVFSVYFEWCILLVILLNTVTMMIKGPDPPGQPSSFASGLAGQSEIDALDIIDLVVTVVFTLEAIFKIWLQGISDYLSDNYSRFDLVSVRSPSQHHSSI